MKIKNSTFIEWLKKYDFSFWGACIALFLIGIVNLYSITHAGGQSSLVGLYKLQVIWFLLALFVGIGISFVHPKIILRFAYSIYFLNCFLLILVLVTGDKGMGATRWLALGTMRIQPSEFMKISLVLALSRWFSKVSPDRPISLPQLIFPFLITLFPMLLIVAQPDLGTGILILLTFLVISFYRQLKWKTILIIGLIGMISGSLMYQFGLKEYQQKRIMTFLNPDADAKGSGYNAIQSKIAIGSGKLWGKGYRKSSQASLNYLPENHTDFVFSIYNEERGFIGSFFLIGLYIILLLRLIWLSTVTTKMFDSIVVVGIAAIFFWHSFVNMSMVTGLLPIVGLPLPFMSYGGSSLMLFGICAGIATSISNTRNFF